MMKQEMEQEQFEALLLAAPELCLVRLPIGDQAEFQAIALPGGRQWATRYITREGLVLWWTTARDGGIVTLWQEYRDAILAAEPY